MKQEKYFKNILLGKRVAIVETNYRLHDVFDDISVKFDEIKFGPECNKIMRIKRRCQRNITWTNEEKKN